MSDDIKKLMEQFKRIDAEMGGKNTPKNDEATRLQEYRNIVEGRISSFTEQKRVNEQKARWETKFGFMRSLNESMGFEKIDGKTFPVQTKTFNGTGTFKYTGKDRSEGVQNYIYPFTLIIDGDASGKPWHKEIPIQVKVSKQTGRLSYAKADGTSYQMPEGKELTFIKRHTPLGPYNLADVFSDKFGESEEFDEAKEKIGDESMSEEILDDCEPGDDFVGKEDELDEARDFMDVSKGGAMQKIKDQVGQFLVDKGCTNENWGKPKTGRGDLVFQHPTIKQLAIGAKCMDWSDGKLAPDLTMFWNHAGTGDYWVVGYNAVDLEDAYAKLLAKAATMHPEDYLY